MIQKNKLDQMIIVPNPIQNISEVKNQTTQSFFNKKKFTEISIIESPKNNKRTFIEEYENESGSNSKSTSEDDDSQSHLDSRVKVNAQIKTYQNSINPDIGTLF
jgi:hypothetical protein